MKKVTIIVLSSIFGLFLLLMTGLYFYASAKITPELVRSVALKQIQATFPAAKIKLGKIDLSFGFSINFELDELDLSLPGKGKNSRLAKIKNLSAEIPIWAIITGGGTIQIHVNNPEVGFYQYGKGNNWTSAMKGKAVPIEKVKSVVVKKKVDKSTKKKIVKVKKESDSTEISIPALASRFRLNVKVLHVLLDYALVDGSKGQLKLERFLLKNLNFETPTAFELLSKVQAEMGKDQTISFEGLVLGELNLGELIKKKEITCKTMVKIRNIKLSSFPTDIPEIKTDLLIKIDNKGKISGSTLTSFSHRNKIGASFSVTPQVISVSKIKAEIFVEDLFKIANFKNNMLSAGKGKLTLGGDVKLVGSKIMPSLEFALKPGIGFKYQAATGISSAKGSFKGTKLFLASHTTVLGGRINLTVKHNMLDINDKNFDPFKLKPFIIDLNIADLKATRSQLQDIIYGGMSKKAPVIIKASAASSVPAVSGSKVGSGTIVKPKSLPPIELPAAIARMKCEHNDFGGSEFTCDGKIKVAKKSIRTEYLKFAFSKGRGKVTHTSHFGSKGIMSKFDFNLSSLDLLSLSPFLPSMVHSVSGIASGKVFGGVDYLNNGQLAYDVKVDTKVSKGEIKGMDLAGKLNKITKSLGSKISQLKNINKIQVGDNFEKMLLKGRFRDTKYDFSKIDFIGLHNKLRLNIPRGGKAYIYPPPHKKIGRMDLDFVEDYGLICNKVKELTGSKIIPIRLEGEQFTLMPSATYTAEKLATRLAKKEIKKAKKKLKKKAKKKLKKLFKF